MLRSACSTSLLAGRPDSRDPLDVLGGRDALLCHHGHRLFRHIPERLSITSGVISDTILNNNR